MVALLLISTYPDVYTLSNTAPLDGRFSRGIAAKFAHQRFTNVGLHFLLKANHP